MSTLSPDVLAAERRAEISNFLTVIAGPWLATGEWPLWGNVQHHFDRYNVDVDDLLQLLPRVGEGPGAPFAAGYGYTTAMRPPIGEEDVVRLTVAASLVLPEMRMVVADPFVRVLNHMIKLHADKPVSPSEVTRAKLRSRELADAMPYLKPWFIQELPGLLTYEPAISTNHMVTFNDGSWELDITRSVLKFRGVTTVEEYVDKTCEIVEANAIQFLPSNVLHVKARNSDVAVPAHVDAPDQARSVAERGPYIDLVLLDEMEEAGQKSTWKHHKLLALCRELNDNYTAGNPYACAALIRAVLDHIPPVFGHKDFKQVAAQHTFAVKRTDKAHAQRLAAFKDIADDVMHRPISANVPIIGMNDLPEPARLNAVLQELLSILR
ncbi:hypothetical protein [Streptomyces sp. NPDC005322]|uniref:hypothetical protein n=1 Tax=Streptomyces sp. NPDC005322 TaxID=3157032 RepID=UPI0033BB4D10